MGPRMMLVLVVCLALALVVPCACSSSSAADVRHLATGEQPQAPVWAPAYELNMSLVVPYVRQVQHQGLRYHISVWRDEELGLLKVLGTEESCSIEDVNKNKRYYVTPEDGKLGCFADHMEEPDGPSLLSALPGRHHCKASLSATLPDLSLPSWKFNGTATVNNASVHVWRRISMVDEGYGQVVTDWKFYVTPDGVPVQLYMHGVNWFGSHYDVYIANYHSYKPGAVDKGVFKVPKVCKKPRHAPALILHHLLHAQLGSLMPPQHRGDQEYDHFVHRHRRHHTSEADYHRRKSHFYRNKAAVETHNQKGDRSYSLALNRFADWSRAEFRAFVRLGGKRGRRPLKDLLKPDQIARHQPVVPRHMLPATVDWRGSGADSPVKDQGMCGSCWAFGSVAPMEAAFYRTYGRQQLLSEQFLMDCSWAFGNTACLGGYQDYGLTFAINSFGIPAEDDYPYIGVNGWCNTTIKRTAAFKRVVEVEGRKEWHLMEAILTKGPMTVSIDAAADSFAFYKDGIYDEPGCATRAEDLDHAVMISGYGVDEKMREYWIVKNTWGPLWGEDGYVRVARKPNDCGVSSQPFYMELDRSATNRLLQHEQH